MTILNETDDDECPQKKMQGMKRSLLCHDSSSSDDESLGGTMKAYVAPNLTAADTKATLAAYSVADT
jgi:hypothetical protein